LSWAEVFEQLEGRAFSSYPRLLAQVEGLRGVPTTSDALGSAWRRAERRGSPRDLVGSLWAGEKTQKDLPPDPGSITSDTTHELSENPITQGIPDSRMSNAPTITGGSTPESPIKREHSFPVRKEIAPSVRIEAPRMTLVPGDIHIPIWDRDLVFAVLAFAEDVGVDHLAIAGDLFDVYGASRFSKSARELFGDRYRFVEELRAATGFFEECNRIFDRVDWLMGNHEGRLDRFVNENPWLYGHPAFDPAALFNVPSNWHTYEWGTMLRIGEVCIAHGDKLRGSGAKYGAASVLRNNPFQHTIFGHTHRIMKDRHTVYDGEGRGRGYEAHSIGHLSHVHHHADYVSQPNWAHGFALVEHDTHRPTIHTVEIERGRWRFGGKQYGV
jgi:predicted phosphodiesterase